MAGGAFAVECHGGGGGGLSVGGFDADGGQSDRFGAGGNEVEVIVGRHTGVDARSGEYIDTSGVDSDIVALDGIFFEREGASKRISAIGVECEQRVDGRYAEGGKAFNDLRLEEATLLADVDGTGIGRVDGVDQRERLLVVAGVECVGGLRIKRFGLGGCRAGGARGND